MLKNLRQGMLVLNLVTLVIRYSRYQAYQELGSFVIPLGRSLAEEYLGEMRVDPYSQISRFQPSQRTRIRLSGLHRLGQSTP
jgi:hypothetical protein